MSSYRRRKEVTPNEETTRHKALKKPIQCIAPSSVRRFDDGHSEPSLKECNKNEPNSTPDTDVEVNVANMSASREDKGIPSKALDQPSKCDDDDDDHSSSSDGEVVEDEISWLVAVSMKSGTNSSF